MRVAVVAEFYPRAHDPVLGVWAHRQAVAARDAGADVRVLVLHRPVPPVRSVREGDWRALRVVRQPRRATLDGIAVEYVPFLAPPRPRSYGAWGAWAAPTLGLALRALGRRFDYELVHAHYAVPAADAVLRARVRRPLVVSEHGGDLYYTAPRSPAGDRAVRRALRRARVVLANSAGIAKRAQALGAGAVRVVHLGADLGGPPAPPQGPPTVVSVGHLVPRKRHADVVRALWLLRDRHPRLRYVVIGDGPQRGPLITLARALGVEERVEVRGALAPAEAAAAARAATVFAMPSTDEALGVAYLEAMAGGVPAIGSRGEPGPEEIAAAGGGMTLVAPADVEALAEALDSVVGDPAYRRELGAAARATVAGAFTWRHCGEATVAAYEEALR